MISVYISKSFFLPSRVHFREEQNHYGSRLLPRHVRETCQVSWVHCEWCWDALLCLSRNQLKIAVFEWEFHTPLFWPWQGHLCFLVHVSLMLVPGRMERKQWGKSLLNLLLKTKVSSCLLYESTGTNRNSSPLRVFQWGFLEPCLISALIARSEGLREISSSDSVLSTLRDSAVSYVNGQHPQHSSYCCSVLLGAEELSEIAAPLEGCVIAIRKTLPQLRYDVLTSISQIYFQALF